MTNNRKSLFRKSLDTVTEYATPLTATILSGAGLFGGIYYLVKEREFNAIPTFVVTIPSLLGSLAWLRETYADRTRSIDNERIEENRQLESEAILKRNAMPKVIYQFETKPMEEERAESKVDNIETVVKAHPNEIYSARAETYKIKSTQPPIMPSLDLEEKEPSEKYISGVIAILDENSAVQIAQTIESFLPIERRSLTLNGKSLDNKLGRRM